MPYNTRSRQHSEAHQPEEEHTYPSKRGRKANGKGARARSSSEERKTSNADQQSRSRSKERRSRSSSRERRGRSRSKSPSTNRARQESGGGRPRSRSRSKEREKDANHHPVKQEEGEDKSQAMDTSGSDKDTGVDLEHGHIYFFYRPKLKTNEKESESESESSKDVQRLFMLLIPHHVKPSEHKEKRIPSLIIIGSKKLPLIQSHEKHWGFVAAASENYHELLKDFKEHTYETKTRGERTVKAIRILGIGAYSISHHQQKRSSYLSYILTDPDPPADVQEDFNLEHEGTFAISVKNPKGTSSTTTDSGGGDGGNDEDNADDTTTSSTSSSRKFNKDPNFPDYLQKQLRDLSFLQLTETTLFLNHPNCQILLVGTRNSIDVDELGKDAVQALNLIVGSIKQKATTTVIDEDLQINLSDYNIEPLKGRWPEKNS